MLSEPKFVAFGSGWIIASGNFTVQELKARFAGHDVLNHAYIGAKVGEHALSLSGGSFDHGLKPQSKMIEEKIVNRDLNLA
jgi:hypothetical protein